MTKERTAIDALLSGDEMQMTRDSTRPIGWEESWGFFGEKAALEAARKLADYIVRRWAAEPPKLPTPWDITITSFS